MARSRLEPAVARAEGVGRPVPIDFGAVRAALSTAARRTADLLRSTGDGGRPTQSLEWSVGEVGAHLVVALQGFRATVTGQQGVIEPFVPAGSRGFRERLSAVTGSTLSVVEERHPAALADLVTAEVAAFLAATSDRTGHEAIETPWYGDQVALRLATATGILLGEQVVHGWDVAHTLGRPWPVDPDHARLVVRAITSVMPLAVNPETTDDVTATFDVRVRGGPRFSVRVDRGTAVVDAEPGDRIDCHISADPVAFMMVAYGRFGQWGQIGRARLLAWGRQPWLGPRFKGFFVNP